MSDRFLVRIEAWPYSSFDQTFAGERSKTFIVKAADIREALTQAENIQAGILTSPWVWQAPIVELRQATDKDYSQNTKGDPCSIEKKALSRV